MSLAVLEEHDGYNRSSGYLKYISDLECFISDAENPVEFQRAFFMVSKPTPEGKMLVPYEPYPYQQKISLDPAELQVICKARQTGISVSTILDKLQLAFLQKNYECLFISLRQVQANDLIYKARLMVRSLRQGYKVKLVTSSRGEVSFKNGSRLMAVSTAESAARSYSSDLVLDEFAFVPNDKGILAAAMQATVRSGFKIRMISTPWGDRGEFARIVKGVEAGEITDWSLHKIHWAECPDLEEKRVRTRCTTEEMFLQEYCCQFLDETTSMLSLQLLLDSTDYDLEQFALNKINLHATSKYFIGVDPGEKVNEAGFVVAENRGSNWYVKHVHAEKFNKDEMVDYTAKWIRAVHPLKVYVDATGAGIGVYQDLQRLFPGIAEEVQLSNPMKEKLVYNMVGLFESGHVYIPDNKKLKYQLHGLERETLPSGMSRYTGKRKTKGFDDLTWALGLAVAYNIFMQNTVEVEMVNDLESIPARRRKYR